MHFYCVIVACFAFAYLGLDQFDLFASQLYGVRNVLAIIITSRHRRQSGVQTAIRIRLALAAACPEADLFRSLPGALTSFGP